MSRRRVLAAAAGGSAGLLMCRVAPEAQGKAFNPALIRPPGARPEREFLQRCMQCGICMKACPTNAIQPTFLEAGVEGIWTPMIVPLIGYCEQNCNLCGQVCPEQAIQPLALEDKQKVKIGLASFDTTRCLPYAYDRECMVCEEHCPLPRKAIFFREKEIKTRNGQIIVIKQPYVDPELCIGCGICENKCVFRDLPAVRVTSANETRHPDNQPVLQGFAGEGYFQSTPVGSTAPVSSSEAQQSESSGSAASADPYK
jgi:ferredoxin